MKRIELKDILNPPTGKVTNKEILTELKREYKLRQKLYPKWLGTKITWIEAFRQMQRLKAAIEKFETLVKNDEVEQKTLF